MVEWINFLQNNSFVNLMRSPLLRRNSRAVALAEPGLTAGWLADDVDQIFKLFAVFNTVTALLEQYECI